MALGFNCRFFPSCKLKVLEKHHITSYLYTGTQGNKKRHEHKNIMYLVHRAIHLSKSNVYTRGCEICIAFFITLPLLQQAYTHASQSRGRDEKEERREIEENSGDVIY